MDRAAQNQVFLGGPMSRSPCQSTLEFAGEKSERFLGGLRRPLQAVPRPVPYGRWVVRKAGVKFEDPWPFSAGAAHSAKSVVIRLRVGNLLQARLISDD